MARIIRDAEVIGKTGVYYKEVCEKLNTTKASFLTHVSSMQTNYVGVDSDAISNILINAINRVDELVEVLTYYSEYMLSTTKYDTDNIENATKKIKSKNTLLPVTPPEEVLLPNMEGEIDNGTEQVGY